MQELLDWLEYIEDDRQQRKVRHTLKDILVIVLFATLANADDWVEMALFAESYQDNLPPFRQMLSKLSHICNTWVLRIKIKDTQGGMKGFSQAGQAIFLTTRINSFLFDTEFIYKASRRKEINLRTINANIKEGLAVSDMGFKVLRREALNFLSILFHRD